MLHYEILEYTIHEIIYKFLYESSKFKWFVLRWNEKLNYAMAHILYVNEYFITKHSKIINDLANIRIGEDVLKTLRRSLSSLFSEVATRHLQGFLKAFWRIQVYLPCLHVFKIPSSCLQACSRHLQEVFKSSSKVLQDVPLTVNKPLQQVFQTYCQEKYPQKVLIWPYFPRIF